MDETEILSAILEELRGIAQAIKQMSDVLNTNLSTDTGRTTSKRFAPDQFMIMNLRPALKEVWDALEKCGGEATSREVAQKMEKKETADDSLYKLTNKYLNELEEINLVTKRRAKIGDRYSIVFKTVDLSEESSS